jgi:hypothetical protein
LLFVTKFEIFKIHIETEQTEVVFKFEPPLVQQPSYFFPNIKQDIYVVGSATDVKIVYINEAPMAKLKKKRVENLQTDLLQNFQQVFDIDEAYQIQNIKQVNYEE